MGTGSRLIGGHLVLDVRFLLTIKRALGSSSSCICIASGGGGPRGDISHTRCNLAVHPIRPWAPALHGTSRPTSSSPRLSASASPLAHELLLQGRWLPPVARGSKCRTPSRSAPRRFRGVGRARERRGACRTRRVKCETQNAKRNRLHSVTRGRNFLLYYGMTTLR